MHTTVTTQALERSLPGVWNWCLCETGKFQASPGMHERENCAARKYAPTTGLADCNQCEPGKYQASSRMHECELCQVGKYQNLHEQQNCKLCPAGKFQASRGGAILGFSPRIQKSRNLFWKDWKPDMKQVRSVKPVDLRSNTVILYYVGKTPWSVRFAGVIIMTQAPGSSTLVESTEFFLASLFFDSESAGLGRGRCSTAVLDRIIWHLSETQNHSQRKHLFGESDQAIRWPSRVWGFHTFWRNFTGWIVCTILYFDPPRAQWQIIEYVTPENSRLQGATNLFIW